VCDLIKYLHPQSRSLYFVIFVGDKNTIKAHCRESEYKMEEYNGSISDQ